MSFLKKKKIIPAILHSKITLAIILVLCVLLGMSVYERYVIQQDMKDRREQSELDLQVLRDRKELLREKVEYLSNDEGREAEIRKYFDVAKEGEQVVVIVDTKREVEQNEEVDTDISHEEISFWERFILW